MNSSVFIKKETPAAADTDFWTKKNNEKVKTRPIDISSSSGSDNNNSSYSSAQSSNVNDPSNEDHDAAISDSLAKFKNLRERLNSYKRNLDVREEISSFSQTKKKPKLKHCEPESPLGFLQPLPPLNFPYTYPVVLDVAPISQRFPEKYNGIYNNNLRYSNSKEGADNNNDNNIVTRRCKQFWKAGDYYEDDANAGHSNSALSSVGIDRVRVHPRFLHSNATSHKWALGAFAELLDNSLDEVCNGATFVNIDMINNMKDGSHMLLVDDNGGGMNPDKMRQCMSLGYSVKSKMANTIGQYGNGFKTSTMRLGADVIVFSRCQEKDGTSSTQSVGMLSYTFLRGTGKEDIVVPMIDYEKSEHGWRETIRTSLDDWNKNLATILQWSPCSSEQHLFQQLNALGEHGTRIIIYNLWEDDEGLLELDFDADPHDIQIRGVNRDEKDIRMAQEYPNCRHFLTYRHSLRSYASILYLRVPPDFRIILRGKDVEHHNIVNDMMLTKEITYRPKEIIERIQKGSQKESDVFATGTIGFVKDAKAHIDVQGFNVYHKNRLIKPFWRVWNPAGSDGRGVIGVLEANFVEPAHDKQGFERTTVLSRLEARLVCMQKDYWSRNCQEVGYAARRPTVNSADKAGSVSNKKKSTLTDRNSHGSATGGSPKICSKKDDKKSSPVNATSEDRNCHKLSQSRIEPQQHHRFSQSRIEPQQHVKVAHCNEAGPGSANHRAENKIKLEEEKSDSRERIMETQGPVMDSLLNDLKQERERCKSLETKVQELEQKVEEADKEQMALIDMLAEERAQRDEEEERLRQKLRDASNTIEKLLEKVKRLEGR